VNKSLMSCAYCIYLVLVNLEFVLCQSTYSSYCAHLQKVPSITAQPLIQSGSEISSLLLNFEFRKKNFISLEVPIQYRKFRSIGISYTVS
jgi:hypothetical protein